MRIHAGLGDLVQQIKEASRNIELSDARKDKRLDSIEASVNELFRKTRRPGGFMVADDDAGLARKSATEVCVIKHALTVPKDDGIRTEYVPDSGAIDEALAARRAFKKMLRHGDPNRLDNLERKSLSAFSFAQ